MYYRKFYSLSDFNLKKFITVDIGLGLIKGKNYQFFGYVVISCEEWKKVYKSRWSCE